MKKRIITMLLAALALMTGIVINTQNVQAAAPVTVYVNDRKVNFPDAPAYIDKNNRTQIPARFIGEALGAQVEWDGSGKRATFSLEIDGVVREVDFYIGSAIYYIKNPPRYLPEKQIMDTVAVIENERTYVPVRYVAEALGASVTWDAETKTAYIASLSEPKPQAPAQEQRDETKYDNQGMMLARYANEYYYQWLDTLRITYEVEKVYFSYTIPDDLPEGTQLIAWIYCDVDYKKRTDYPDGWNYQTIEITRGDRAKGYGYLIPAALSGDVKIEMSYLPLNDICNIHTGCSLRTIPEGIPGTSDTLRYAQSTLSVNIDARNLRESELLITAFDKQGAYMSKLWEEYTYDAAAIVKFE